MYLASIYFENHYLFDKPQTINFGGRYIYNFSNILGITRSVNEKYIENFYIANNLELVSAIVGRNGTGKTTLLKDVINFLKGHGEGIKYILFLEDGISTYTMSSSLVFGCDFTERSLDLSFETLYYSPYLDFKEPVSGIDLSFDTILEEDFEASSGKFVGYEAVNPKRWLKSQNSLRILEFQFSKYAVNLKTFFDFPDFDKARISFIRYKIDVDNITDKIQFHNTPMELQYSLQPLYDLIRKDGRNINGDRPKGYSLVKLQKKLFKNYLLLDLVCLLIRQMEKTNQYLMEGHLEISSSEYENHIKDLNSKDALYKFLDLHYYKVGGDKSKILPVEETKEMINYLFNIIDKLEAKNDRDTRNFDWSNKSIYLNNEQTRQLIDYHTQFLNKIDQYYGGIRDSDGQILFRKSERIEGLINYEPSERNLSSGETALLNFYSRIYYYFNKQLINLKSIKKKDFYIILLDEADMGYHPKWKKSFVKSILSFLPSFFKSLDAKLQIIFTTHDALTLSDIPNTQITYLDKIGDVNVILNESNKPKKSFGANITDLLADSFFVGDGLIGNFAKDKINETIEWLNYKKLDLEIKELRKSEKKDNNKKIIEAKLNELSVLKKAIKNDDSNYHQKLIYVVDEPVLKTKLMEMYSEVYKENHKHLEIELKNLADKLGYDISPKIEKK